MNGVKIVSVSTTRNDTQLSESEKQVEILHEIELDLQIDPAKVGLLGLNADDDQDAAEEVETEFREELIEKVKKAGLESSQHVGYFFDSILFPADWHKNLGSVKVSATFGSVFDLQMDDSAKALQDALKK